MELMRSTLSRRLSSATRAITACSGVMGSGVFPSGSSSRGSTASSVGLSTTGAATEGAAAFSSSSTSARMEPSESGLVRSGLNRGMGPGRSLRQFSRKASLRERSIWRTSFSPRVDACPLIQARACANCSLVMFNVSIKQQPPLRQQGLTWLGNLKKARSQHYRSLQLLFSGLLRRAWSSYQPAPCPPGAEKSGMSPSNPAFWRGAPAPYCGARYPPPGRAWAVGCGPG